MKKGPVTKSRPIRDKGGKGGKKKVEGVQSERKEATSSLGGGKKRWTSLKKGRGRGPAGKKKGKWPRDVRVQAKAIVSMHFRKREWNPRH